MAPTANSWATSKALPSSKPASRSSRTSTRESEPRKMKYHDLRDFIAQLEQQGELKRVRTEVDPRLEMTEICDRVLRAEGPAILFETPKGHTIPVLANLFGTPKRVAMGMGEDSVAALREVGKL